MTPEPVHDREGGRKAAREAAPSFRDPRWVQSNSAHDLPGYFSRAAACPEIASPEPNGSRGSDMAEVPAAPQGVGASAAGVSGADLAEHVAAAVHPVKAVLARRKAPSVPDHGATRIGESNTTKFACPDERPGEPTGSHTLTAEREGR